MNVCAMAFSLASPVNLGSGMLSVAVRVEQEMWQCGYHISKNKNFSSN